MSILHAIRTVGGAAIAMAAASVPLTASAQPSVSLELVTDGPLLGAERDWMRMAQELPSTTVRIRGAREGDLPKVTNVGTKDRPRYRVIGVLVSANKLVLPGGVAVTRSERDKLAQWIGRLQADGEESMTALVGPFGLTPKQLGAAQQQLSGPVDFSTKGLPYGPAAQRMEDAWKMEVRWSPAARESLAANSQERILDELKGLSGGAALAALLRPLGLAFALDRRPGEEPHIKIDRRDQLQETWPLGWPLEDAPVTTVPKLFERITVEIKKTPLTKALDALNGRIGLPVLMDHNSILLQQVDLETRVSLPEGKQFYRRIYDVLLYQAGLKLEIKLDDAKQPFLWITTIRR